MDRYADGVEIANDGVHLVRHLVPLAAVEFDMYGHGDDRYCGRVEGNDVRELRAGELRRIEFVAP